MADGEALQRLCVVYACENVQSMCLVLTFALWQCLSLHIRE